MSCECATKAQRFAKHAAGKSDCVRGRAVVRKLAAFAELVDVGARAIKKRRDLTHVERRAAVRLAHLWHMLGT